MVAEHLVHVDEVVHDNLVVQLRGLLRLVAGHAGQAFGKVAFADVGERVINVRAHFAPQGNPVGGLVFQITVAHHAGVFHPFVVDVGHRHGIVRLGIAFRVGRIAVVIFSVVAIDGQVGSLLQRGGINLAGRQRVVVQARKRHVQPHVQVLVQFRVQVQTGGKPLHVVVDNVRLVVVIRKAHEIRGTPRPAGDGGRHAVAHRRARHRVEPVGVGCGTRIVRRVVILVIHHGILVPVQQVQLTHRAVEAQRIAHIDARLVTAALLRGDQDDPRRAARAINGCGKSVLQDFNGLNVLRIQRGQRVLLKRILQIIVIVQRSATHLVAADGRPRHGTARVAEGIVVAVGAIHGHPVNDIERVVVAHDGTDASDSQHVRPA